MWKGKVYKRSERFRNLETSDNIPKRYPQNLSTKQQRKRVVKYMNEEAKRCGSDKSYHSKQFKTFRQFLSPTCTDE